MNFLHKMKLPCQACTACRVWACLFSPSARELGVCLCQQWTDLLVFHFFWLLFATGQVRCFRMGGWLFSLKSSIYYVSQKNHFAVVWWSRQMKRLVSVPAGAVTDWNVCSCFFWTCLYQYQLNTLMCKLSEAKGSSWESATVIPGQAEGCAYIFF